MHPVDSYINDQYSPYTNKTKDLDPYKSPYKIHTRKLIHTPRPTILCQKQGWGICHSRALKRSRGILPYLHHLKNSVAGRLSAKFAYPGARHTTLHAGSRADVGDYRSAIGPLSEPETPLHHLASACQR